MLTSDFSRKRLSTFLAAATILLLPALVTSGDPCPSKDSLLPCTCTQVPLDRLESREGRAIASENDLVTPSMTEVKEGRKEPQSPETSLSNPRSSSEVSPTAFPIAPNSSFYTVVTCKVPRTQYVLEEVVTNALHRKWVDRLVISNLPPLKEHTLVRLPSNWLKNLRVKQFEIRETLLSGDFVYVNSPFAGQEESLVWFTAQNCYLSGGITYDTIGTVNTRGLNSLPRIEGLDLSRNHLVYVHAIGFRYPPNNLTSVILSFNSIVGIEGTAFHYIPKLKYLDISHNQLESVARNIFLSPAVNLEHMDFSWNRLTVLPADFFVNLPKLRIVKFTNNFLYSMPDKPWATSWRQLTYVDVRGNFIQCNCDLMWLLPILSPPEVNVTTTPPPRPLQGQTVLGACAFTQPQLYSKKYLLVNLTRSDLNC